MAEECGFASHSSFATVFRNITGISPSVFIREASKNQSS
ncbi:AraC family transcriptional regulator [Epilithonimonas hispanica]